MAPSASPSNHGFRPSAAHASICRSPRAFGESWTYLEVDGAEAAIKYLDNLPYSQPWVSDVPYVDNIRAAIKALHDAEGLEAYHRGFFKG